MCLQEDVERGVRRGVGVGLSDPCAQALEEDEAGRLNAKGGLKIFCYMQGDGVKMEGWDVFNDGPVRRLSGMRCIIQTPRGCRFRTGRATWKRG